MIQPARDKPACSNHDIAEAFRHVADLLEAQGANPYRVRAYRQAALTLTNLRASVAEILREHGIAGLMQISGIGQSLAHSIDQFVSSGRLALLDRLRGEDVAERMFATVPDIGPQLAHRIHEHLGIETLAELAAAARDGRLAKIPGMGEKRVRAVRESLAGRFAEPAGASAGAPDAAVAHDVPVARLLDIDQEYRQLAAAGRLPRVAPRQFNPTRQAWLPILHTTRRGRAYTALFSNTARAHQLGAIQDWVVIYDDRDTRDHWTVITASFGPLRGRRIVCGREKDCQAHYAVDETSPARQGLLFT